MYNYKARTETVLVLSQGVLFIQLALTKCLLQSNVPLPKLQHIHHEAFHRRSRLISIPGAPKRPTRLGVAFIHLDPPHHQMPPSIKWPLPKLQHIHHEAFHNRSR